jgi:hypothetical protein
MRAAISALAFWSLSLRSHFRKVSVYLIVITKEDVIQKLQTCKRLAIRSKERYRRFWPKAGSGQYLTVWVEGQESGQSFASKAHSNQ